MIYNLPIREVLPTLALMPAPVTLAPLIEDDDDRTLSFLLSDDNTTSLVRQSSRSSYEPNWYRAITHYMVLFTVIQNKICESLSDKKAI